MTGTYVTSQFDALAGHYSWPCNVFNNKCFYGVGFLVIACDRYLKKVFHRPWCATKEERVYHREGIVLTHVLVTFNRSIAQGHSRARYFLPRCEFRHGVHRCLRKYPDLRPSVWCDIVQNEAYEANGRPSELPVSDTHNYDAVCPVLMMMDPLIAGHRILHPAMQLAMLGMQMKWVIMILALNHSIRCLLMIHLTMSRTPAPGPVLQSSSLDMTCILRFFQKLEIDWLHERDPLQQQSLYSSVQEAEVAFALKYGIYSDLVTGNQLLKIKHAIECVPG